MPPLLVVPGDSGSGPRHWQTGWEQKLPFAAIADDPPGLRAVEPTRGSPRPRAAARCGRRTQTHGRGCPFARAASSGRSRYRRGPTRPDPRTAGRPRDRHPPRGSAAAFGGCPRR
ncbi:uncharacterized protein SOCE836_018590 [Sorangium cellulosum]|uniref:Uncharacterized protein n=1 Tax=Sorangium cellulosum TaxID=56 RepID=A0A4P2QJB1_SORCE|nr:uncharacterized protein SOCE836_018590 [Sorangium cellulosum]